MKRLLLGFLVLLSATGCQVKSALVKPPRGEGKVFVYLAPLPQEADRLSFRLAAVSAVRDEGEEFPLSLHESAIAGRGMKRERLVASAGLPPGNYAGLSFRAEKAFLEGEEGKADLRVPDTAVLVRFPFIVNREKGLVLSLALRASESIREGFYFTPAFSVSIPGRLNTGTIGLATAPRSDTVTIFDKVSGHVSEILLPGNSPAGIALDRRRVRAYVALSGDDAVAVVDLLSSEIRDRIRLRGGDAPDELALAPDGSVLLAANSGSNTVSFLDPASLFETARIRVGNGPRSVLIDPAGKRAFVFNTLSDTLSVIDISLRALAAEIAVDPGPLRGQFDRSGKTLFVIHERSPYLTVFDPATLGVVRRVYVGMGATALKFDAASEQIYLSKRNENRVEVYDPLSLLPWTFLNVPGEVSYMTIDGEKSTLVLAIAGEKSVEARNLFGFDRVWAVDLGDEPYRVTLAGER